MTFDQVMTLTRTNSSPAAFEEPECKAYFDILMSLPKHSNILEIGMQFGRSSSIALQVAKERSLHYIGIDPFIDPPEAWQGWINMARGIGYPFTWHCCESHEAINLPGVSLVLVDGNHWEEYVRKDIAIYSRLIWREGYMLFHDFGEQQLPDVYPTVDAKLVRALMSHWEELPTVGCLGIFRRPL